MLSTPVSVQPSPASALGSHGGPAKRSPARQITAAVGIALHPCVADDVPIVRDSQSGHEATCATATCHHRGSALTLPKIVAARRSCVAWSRQVRTEDPETLPLSGPDPKTFAVGPGQLLNVRPVWQNTSPAVSSVHICIAGGAHSRDHGDTVLLSSCVGSSWNVAAHTQSAVKGHSAPRT